MNSNIVLLCGGIGGAKLALGLYHELGIGRLTIITNIGDDFIHLGLKVCPDLDTVLYTLAGCVDLQRGWGRRGETWHFMKALKELGGVSWFNLGDADLALHVQRTQQLAKGESLTDVMRSLSTQLKVNAKILPASEQSVPTIIHTDAGPLSFQEYFVRARCEPRVSRIESFGASKADPAPAVVAALADPNLQAILVAPSNPFLSIDPILAVKGMSKLLKESRKPIIAITPLLAGQAVKGPTAKIMAELGIEPSTLSVAKHYGRLITGIMVDARDDPRASYPVKARTTDTLMNNLADRRRVAREALAWVRELQP